MSYDKNIYARIVSNELTKDEVQQLKDSGEWDEIQKILKVSSNFKTPFQDDKGYDKLIAKRDAHTKPSARIFTLRKILSVAAICFVILTLSMLFLDGDNEFEADFGETVTVNLPDQSKVTLNDGSSISYNREYTQNKLVQLKGEALFEVEKGQLFTVKSPQGEVSVLGTVFNVNSWNSTFKVSCFEGSVEVKRIGQIVALKAGQGAEISEHGIVKNMDLSNDTPYWTKGESRFTNQEVSEVFDEMERQFDIEIENQVNPKIFSGKFSHTDLNEALTEVCKPLGLDFERVNTRKVRVF